VPGLNNVATADVYTGATEVVAPKLQQLDVIVSNAAVYMQLGVGWPGQTWLAEEFKPPNNYVLDRSNVPGLSGVRFRSAVPATPGRVTVSVLQDFGA
jgi:hypothetical protein